MSTIGVFAIIADEQRRVLLCHRRDHDWWNLPGGRVEVGETPWAALIREVREKVGLVIEIDKLLGIYAYPPADDFILSFACSVVSGAATLSDEADIIAYFATDALPTTTHPHHAIRIHDSMRSQDITLATLPAIP